MCSPLAHQNLESCTAYLLSTYNGRVVAGKQLKAAIPRHTFAGAVMGTFWHIPSLARHAVYMKVLRDFQLNSQREKYSQSRAWVKVRNKVLEPFQIDILVPWLCSKRRTVLTHEGYGRQSWTSYRHGPLRGPLHSASCKSHYSAFGRTCFLDERCEHWAESSSSSLVPSSMLQLT